MLYAYYRETHLEQWMNTKYLNHGISSPADLDIDRIAEAFGIGLVYGNHPSFSDNEENVIFLNKMMQADQSRVVFFHELCHVLRHAGDQRRMTELFMHAQETEAEQFVLYAAIPFYMFAKLPVPDHRSEAVAYSSRFPRSWQSSGWTKSNGGCCRAASSQLPRRQPAASAKRSRAGRRKPGGYCPSWNDKSEVEEGGKECGLRHIAIIIRTRSVRCS
ncbi:ImmA/IrrE family metallo-endopeptidase [Paenibacillus sp. 3LSP]|uniref:ImmA/IrrE family metallo-endopeptidase n=1 Tax=Paenibacillus sp. 3LSP TaxID=2800795 RepID=UPI0028FD4029|nr:ImmA/IrrE family metallo-endopeptidase [Paenibacillus sp. 3LSP]MDU0329214.1 ImmA/IrrE family metallo-endopeptidase [Paenibacillus sp. 3LSP]